MSNQDFIQGSQNQWKLVQRLAEGDAGEVYLVESLRERKAAVLKRPRRSSFTGEMQRQASQIEAESRILKALSALQLPNGNLNLCLPALLDQSLPGNELSDRFFIIIDQAAGSDLASIQKTVRFGLEEGAPLTPAQAYLRQVAGNGRFPPLLALRAVVGLFRLLPAVHTCHPAWMNDDTAGVLWNDVKPEHLFWDPLSLSLTVIDWGNGQFIGPDEATADRRYSTTDDYRQLVDQMGKFLAEAAPALHTDLQWPASISPDQANPAGLRELQERAETFLAGELQLLKETRKSEFDLLELTPETEALLAASPETSLQFLDQLETVQRQILEQGELPDYDSTARLYGRVASVLAGAGQMQAFRQLCSRVSNLPGVETAAWGLLDRLASLSMQENGEIGPSFRQAVISGLKQDWTEALWDICLATRSDVDQMRWRSLSAAVRRLVPEVNTGFITPLAAATRLLQMLEDALSQLKYRLDLPPGSNGPGEPDETTAALEAASTRLRDDLIGKWCAPNPPPPGADLGYASLDALLAELEVILPTVTARTGLNPAAPLAALSRALSQPRAQTEIIFDAWRGRGFRTAGLGLRRLLLWDPDRLRLLQIEAAIQETPAWIDDVHDGPKGGEKLIDYAIRMEYKGRFLRSRVGSAHWLESLLQVFGELRSGTRPGDLLEKRPSLSDDFPWLRRYARRSSVETFSTSASRAAARLRSGAGAAFYPDGLAQINIKTLGGREGRLGPKGEISLGDPLDAWVGEARGSSARVFTGTLRSPAGNSFEAAVKVIRPDKLDYALPLFLEESRILPLLQDVRGVVRLYECGFIELEDPFGMPSDDSHAPATGLTGRALRYSASEADLFAAKLEERAAQGWLPYLAIEPTNNQHNLLLACDEGFTRGGYLPVETAMQAAVQMCEIIHAAHERDILYRDHKIIHYYWDPDNRRVTVIDWNIARWSMAGATDAEIQADLVQLGARGLHHLFCGRPAPGALPVGPTLPGEIEAAPLAYPVAWTYDDQQRLPADMRDLLARLLSGEYLSAARLREDLLMMMPHI